MKNLLAGKIKTNLWQRIFSQFLFCSIILIANTKKAFGIEPSNAGGAGYVSPPTLADIVTPLANYVLTAAYSFGIILYLLYFYFYPESDKKNIEWRNKKIKLLFIILALITIGYFLLMLLFKITFA